jgi:hypothetical protein
MRTQPDVFFAACAICTAADRQAAQQGAIEFHSADCPGFADTAEKLFPVALSPSGKAPPTHYLCTRHVDAKELDRIEAFQCYCESQGRKRALVYHVSADPIQPIGRTLKGALAKHEAQTLARLGLRRIE